MEDEMSTHPTARAARDRSPRRWRPPAAALAAALLLAGGALTARGPAGPGGGPHPQPLPARLFAISPAAAQAMAGLLDLVPGAGLGEYEAEVLVSVRERGDPPPDRNGDGQAGDPGHVDNASQGDGAFYFLYQIKPGALITVTGPGRHATTWRAYKTVIAEKTALPPGIFSLSGPRRLILVTCGGPLEHTPAGNTYRDNILLYATTATT
jgi:hypothetical protein